MSDSLHTTPSYRRKLWLLLAVSLIARTFLAFWLELGNDEVYYYTYALFPDLSHFDHPPMIGWMIQLFSLNLRFDNELALRLSSVVLMTANTALLFFMGKSLRNERTGWYAALLYTASVYAFVITGLMILPDTPQNFFWMLSLWMMLTTVKEGQGTQTIKRLLPIIGLSIGLGMISKYTSAFLWLGYGLFILFKRRQWLRFPSFYLALLVSALCLLPVMIWNFQNHFISFSFHGERLNILHGGLRLSYFFRELAGQFLYNNPVVFILVWVGVVAVIGQKKAQRLPQISLLLFIGLPLIGIFIFFSLFRETLPHWTGPAYNSLLLVAAFALDGRAKTQARPIAAALALLFVIIAAGSLQVKFGLIPTKNNHPYHLLGKNDVSLDMFGWRKLKPEFEKIRAEKIRQGQMQANDGLLGENWFPLANLDYYVGRPLGLKTFGMGKPERLHKYLWINNIRGGFHLGDSFWYLTSSRDYKDPCELYSDYFEQIAAADTIEIKRGGKPAKRYFVYLLKELKQLPPDYFAAKPSAP